MCSVDMPETQEIPMPFAPVKAKKAKIRGKRISERRTGAEKLRIDRDQSGFSSLLIPMAKAATQTGSPLSVPPTVQSMGNSR